MEKANFPYDPVNRIQKLYYEYDFDDIPTIYNKNKLIKTKTKLIKYWKYCMEHVKIALTPQIEEWDKQFADLTKELDELESNEEQLKKQNLVQEKKKLHNITLNVIKRRNDVRRHNQSVSLEREMVHTMCVTLGLKMDYMIAQIRRIRKNYKKCNHCKKTAMITICDCKSKHRLCSECIDDKTECPVCKDDFGLQYCAICMENKNKKDVVNTGCKNEHKTCKECLDKIKKNNNMCPFCREGLGPIHTLITYNVDGPPSVRIYTEDEWSSIEAQNPNVIDLDLNEHIDTRNRRQAVRDSLIRYRTDDMTPYNNFQTWLETNGVRERIDELPNNVETREEDDSSNEQLDISDRDIELIMMQARCTKEEAINAFKDNDMDIVSAIMYLTR